MRRIQLHAMTHDCCTLQHTAAYCSTLQHTATHSNAQQHTATAHCSTLQLTATHSNAQQHTTARYSTQQHLKNARLRRLNTNKMEVPIHSLEILPCPFLSAPSACAAYKYLHNTPITRQKSPPTRQTRFTHRKSARVVRQSPHRHH